MTILQAQANKIEASFLTHFLWLTAATQPSTIVTQSTLFVFRWKTVWKMFSFCIFRWFQSSLTYHDSCGLHWPLHSYSSQESEGYKLKDGAYYCYCAYVLRISRYSDFLSPMLTNTGIFSRGLKLSGKSRS